MPRKQMRGNAGPPIGPRGGGGGGGRGGRGGRGGGQRPSNPPFGAHQNERSDHYNKMCNVHGWNASHVTKDCKQAQNPNQNQDPRQNQAQYQNTNQNQGQYQNPSQRYCDYCQTTTHNTAYCKKQSNSQSTRHAKPPPPINTTRSPSKSAWVAGLPSAMDWSSTAERAERNVLAYKERYCIFCNDRSHTKHTCTNEPAMRDYFQSRIICRGCASRGHLSDDCKNPEAARCPKCFRRGHAPFDCIYKPNPNPPMSALRTSFLEPATKRFVWPTNDEALHKSQQMRAIYEETLLRLAREGRTLSEEQRQATERQIANAANVFPTPATKRPRGESRVHWGVLPEGRTPTCINPIVKRHPSSIMIRKNSARPKDFVSPTALRNVGLKTPDISKFESFLITQKQAAITERQRMIRSKIDSSRVYGLEPVNNMLLRLETRVLELQLVTQQRFDQVKWAIRNGYKFFRDPRVMEALFARQVPRCNGCAKRGEVLDQHFNVVPATATKNDLLNLSDYRDWGLFVVMSCECPGPTGYWYQDRTPLELEGLVDDDE